MESRVGQSWALVSCTLIRVWLELLEALVEHDTAANQAKVGLLALVHQAGLDGICCREVVGSGGVAGHLTAAGWVLNPARDRVLLVSDAKLQAVTLPGGHLESEQGIGEQALKWVRQFTGLEARLLQQEPFDLAARQVPAYWNTPAHWHYELRFLMTASDKPSLPPTARWLTGEQAGRYEGMERLVAQFLR